MDLPIQTFNLVLCDVLAQMVSHYKFLWLICALHPWNSSSLQLLVLISESVVLIVVQTHENYSTKIVIKLWQLWY
jgi:hypothetical protein